MKKLFFLIFCVSVAGCDTFPTAKYYVETGDRAYAAFDFKTAADKYDQALKIDPKFALAYAGRGFVKSDTGNIAGAVKDFDIAISLKLNDKKVFYKAGIDKCILEDYDGAVVTLTKAIQLDGNFAEAYLERSRAKIWQKDTNGALADIEKSISLKPRDMKEALILRGTIKLALADTLGACASYHAARVEKNDLNHYNNDIDTLIKVNCQIKKH